jgi:hypothetical protein
MRNDQRIGDRLAHRCHQSRGVGLPLTGQLAGGVIQPLLRGREALLQVGVFPPEGRELGQQDEEDDRHDGQQHTGATEGEAFQAHSVA